MSFAQSTTLTQHRENSLASGVPPCFSPSHPSVEQESLILSLDKVCFKSSNKDSEGTANSWQNLVRATESRTKHNCVPANVSAMYGSGSSNNGGKSSSGMSVNTQGQGNRGAFGSSGGSGSSSSGSGSGSGSGSSGGFSNWFFKGQSDSSKNSDSSFSSYRNMNTWMPTSM